MFVWQTCNGVLHRILAKCGHYQDITVIKVGISTRFHFISSNLYLFLSSHMPKPTSHLLLICHKCNHKRVYSLLPSPVHRRRIAFRLRRKRRQCVGLEPARSLKQAPLAWTSRRPDRFPNAKTLAQRPQGWLMSLARDLLKCWISRSVSHKYPNNKHSTILSPRNPV